MDAPILIAELGSGGMADVFLAIRRGAGGFVKLLVIKQLREDGLEGDALAMFTDEARISARLNHPNVVQTGDVSYDGKNYRLEMEFLDGQPLNRIVARLKKAKQTLDMGTAVAIVRDVLAGLHYAHELADYDGSPLNIVHRDVSPQNIFVTYAGRVKVVDFGIAKAAGQMAVTAMGMMKGKIRYMAPEQAMTAIGRSIDRRADIFATGIVLWQLLTGMPYWGDADEMEIFRRLTTGDLPPNPRAVRPEIPEALDQVCARALAFSADERFATAHDFELALEESMPPAPGAERALGEQVAQLFADKRETLRAVIEQAVARTEPSAEDAAEPMKLSMSMSSSSLSLPAIPRPLGTSTSPPPSDPPVTTQSTHPGAAPGRGVRVIALAAAGFFAAAAIIAGVVVISRAHPKDDGAAHASSSAQRWSPPPPSTATSAATVAAATLSANAPPSAAPDAPSLRTAGVSRGGHAAWVPVVAPRRPTHPSSDEPQQAPTAEAPAAPAPSAAPAAPSTGDGRRRAGRPGMSLDSADPWDAGAR